MGRLNYKHLEYFWAVAREGSVTRAAESLFVSQPAISAQIRKLEDQFGEKLFEKRGRTLELTAMGRVAFGYADEIFSLGRELTQTIRGQPTERPLRLAVGVAQALPKLAAYQLVAPALEMDRPVRLVFREDQPDRLFAELALHSLDLVLTDAPLPESINVKAYNHLLGECGVSFMGAPGLADRFRNGFPDSLDGAPLLLPTTNTMLRRALERWFGDRSIRPLTVAEIEDSAVLKVFGQEGAGLFAVPTVVEGRVRDQYGVELVGRENSVRERFFGISAERRIKHPAVVVITEAARQSLFGGSDSAR